MLQSSNSNDVQIIGNVVYKRFVKPISSRPYESLECLTKENSMMIPSKEKFDTELEGHNVLKGYFPVPRIINIDESRSEISYEAFLPSVGLDKKIQGLIACYSGSLENKLISVNRDLGGRLRKLHEETFSPDDYSVKGLFDLHDGNVLVGRDEEYKLIDFESFGSMKVYDSLFKLALSQMVTATGYNDNPSFDESSLPKIKSVIDGFFEGYLLTVENPDVPYPAWLSGEMIDNYQKKGDLRLDLYSFLGQISPRLDIAEKAKVIDYMETEILEPKYIFF